MPLKIKRPLGDVSQAQEFNNLKNPKRLERIFA